MNRAAARALALVEEHTWCETPLTVILVQRAGCAAAGPSGSVTELPWKIVLIAG